MIVGLTGRYCAGKDTVARIFAEEGFSVIDVDEVGHDVLVQKAAEIISTFGSSVRAADGTVDRKALGRIVFASPGDLAELESIVHPAMTDRVASIAASARTDVLINAAVLFKMGLDSLCGAVFCVTAPALLRVLRAVRRDRLSLREALRRVYGQKGICLKSRGSTVDIYNVANWGNVASLEKAVRATLGRLERGKTR